MGKALRPQARYAGWHDTEIARMSRRTMALTRILLGALLLIGVPSFANAVEKSNDAVWYERIDADCKLQAKKYYSVLHFKKRRIFIRRCIERAYR